MIVVVLKSSSELNIILKQISNDPCHEIGKHRKKNGKI